MLKVIVWFTFFTASLSAATIPLTLEHAYTFEQLSWGLMQRSTLHQDHGMLFHYPKEEFISVWMFNCLKDLSAAFLNSQGIILEIHELKAYPDNMDPKRPVHSVQDFAKYSYDDPVSQFFIKNGIKSSSPVRYLLEMEAGWFKEKGIHPGDRLTWNSSEAYIQRNL